MTTSERSRLHNNGAVEPLCYKYTPPDANRSGGPRNPSRIIEIPERSKQVIQDEPGYAGIYPCYSLVEDTECI